MGAGSVRLSVSLISVFHRVKASNARIHSHKEKKPKQKNKIVLPKFDDFRTEKNLSPTSNPIFHIDARALSPMLFYERFDCSTPSELYKSFDNGAPV